MADLLTISKQVATELGRPELVASFSTGDYTPTDKFKRIINAANKRLERMVDHHAEFRRIPVDVEAGDYFLNLPKEIQYIDSIDIESATTRYPVTPRSDAYMREEYNEPFSLVESGRPVDWCRWTADEIRFTNRVVNGDFVENTDSWVQDAGTLSWSAGKARITSSGMGAGMYQLFSPAISLRGHRLNSSLTPVGAVTNYWISLWNDTDTITIFPWNQDGLVDLDERVAYMVEQGIYTQAEVDTVMDACDRIAIVAQGGNGVYLEVDNVSISTAQTSSGNLLILPPADAAYTLYVRARVYADYMDSNNDTTYFSNRHPDILVTMVKRQIAVEINRNATERDEYDQELAGQIFEIERAQGAEDQAGDIATTRMGYLQ